MGNILGNDLDEYIVKRCQAALQEDEEYMEMERSGEIPQEILQAKAEVLCYKQCIKDVMAIREL